MKLKEFNLTVCPPRQRKQLRNIMRVTKSSGVIYFSAEAVSMMDLHENEGIIVLQDEKFPQDFYLAKSNKPDAFILRRKGAKDENKCLVFQSTALAKIMLEALKIDHSAGFVVADATEGPSGMPVHAVITAQPIKPR